MKSHYINSLHTAGRLILATMCALMMALAIHPLVLADEPIGAVPLSIPEDIEPVLDPDNNRLYMLSDEYTLEIIDGNTPSKYSVTLPNDNCDTLALDNPNGRLYTGCSIGCLNCSTQMSVTVINTPWSIGPTYTFTKNPQDSIADMALSGDGQYLYIALKGTNGDVVVVNALDGTEVRRLAPSGSDNRGEQIAVDPISNLIFYHYVQDTTHKLRIWNDSGGLVNSETLTPTYGSILLDTDDRRVYIGNLVFDADNGTLLSDTFSRDAQAINPHTNVIYAADYDTSILYAIDGLTYEETAIKTFSGDIGTVGVAPGTHKIYVGTTDFGPEKHLLLLDPSTYNTLQDIDTLSAHRLTFNPLNHQVYVESYNMPNGESGVYVLDGAPTLDVSRDTLSFSALEGGTPPAARSIRIASESGGGSLEWEIESNSDWLVLNRTGGILPNNGYGDYHEYAYAYVNHAGMAAGTYNGTITVSDPSAKAGLHTIDVQLTIGDGTSPLLRVDKAQPTRFEYMGGISTPVSQTLGVRNLGLGELTYTISEDIPWLDLLGPASGSADSNGVEIGMQLNASVADLAAGQYTGVLTITSDAAGSPQFVNVTLICRDLPSMTVNTTKIIRHAYIEEGDPATRLVQVRNAGGGIFTWNATTTTSWLGIEDRTLNDFRVATHIAGLDLNESTSPYRGSITVASPDSSVANNPTEIDVFLSVDTQRRMELENTKLNYIFHEGNTAYGRSFTIRNSGNDADFQWTAEANEPWIQLSATSGTVNDSGQTIEVTLDENKLTPGIHQGTITVHGDNVKGETQTVHVIATMISAATPNCKVYAGIDLLRTEDARISGRVTGVTPNSDGFGCDITGNLSVRLLGRHKTLTFDGAIDAGGQVSEVAMPDSLTLDVAGVALTLSDITMGPGYVEAMGTWSFAKIGGGSQNAGRVRFDENGLSFSGGMSFPLKQSLSFQGFNFSTSQATLVRTDSYHGFRFEVDGELTFKVFGNEDMKVDLTIYIDEHGVRSKFGNTELPIPGFSFEVAGLTLQAYSGKLRNGEIYIPGGRLYIRTGRMGWNVGYRLRYTHQGQRW